MPGDGETVEVVGDLSPAELARYLDWSLKLVRKLIDEGAIARTDAGWRIDTTDLPRRWAQAQWHSAPESEKHPPHRPGTGPESNGEA